MSRRSFSVAWLRSLSFSCVGERRADYLRLALVLLDLASEGLLEALQGGLHVLLLLLELGDGLDALLEVLQLFAVLLDLRVVLRLRRRELLLVLLLQLLVVHALLAQVHLQVRLVLLKALNFLLLLLDRLIGGLALAHDFPLLLY